MIVSPQPRVSALLRIFAGTCALFWLAGIAVCGIARVCSCVGHDGACAAQASPVHDHTAVSTHEHGHSQDAENHHEADVHRHATASKHQDGEASQSCTGKNGCTDTRCCSTIQALIVTPTPIIIAKPVSQTALLISLLWAAHGHTLTASSTEAWRRAKPRDWVSTPEMCLGPALHSRAPPASL